MIIRLHELSFFKWKALFYHKNSFFMIILVSWMSNFWIRSRKFFFQGKLPIIKLLRFLSESLHFLAFVRDKNEIFFEKLELRMMIKMVTNFEQKKDGNLKNVKRVFFQIRTWLFYTTESTLKIIWVLNNINALKFIFPGIFDR